MKKTILAGAARCLVIPSLIAFFLVMPSWSQENSNQPVPQASEKSPNTALLLSLIGTTVPYAIRAIGSGTNSEALSLAAGALFLAGPSLGFFYGGLAGRGLAGVGLRLLGATLATIGLVNTTFAIFGGETSAESSIIPLYIGMGIVLASTIWDLASVKGAVRKHNEKMRATTLALSPFLNPRTKTAGLCLQISF